MKFKNIQMGWLGALLLWCPNLCAQTTIVVDGVEFTTLDNSGKPGEVMLSKYPSTGADVYTVPSSVTDEKTGMSYRVTIIGEDCFSNAQIREVTMPESVDSLQNNALCFSNTLEYIDLSQSNIDWIGDYAFIHNPNLKEVKFPQYLRNLGDTPFMECPSLTRAELPEGIKTLRHATFKKCSALTYVSLPEGLEMIDTEAFLNCKNLETVVMPSTLNFIKGGSFTGSGQFRDGRRLTMVFHSAVPPTVTTDPFNNADNAGFPDKMSAIVPMGCTEDYANNSYWELFTWPAYKGKREILEEETCGDMVYRVVNSAAEEVKIIRMSDPQAASVKIPATIKSAKGVTYTVTEIGADAFKSSPHLASVDFSESVVQRINQFAFAYCDKLESISLPATATNMSYNVFSYCNHLKTVVLPDDLTEIPNNIFNSCGELKNVNIPAGVKTIQSSAFYSCISLESLQLPDGLEIISDYAFSKCLSLHHLALPASVKEIRNQAFEGSGLQEVDLSHLTLTSMGENAFDQCLSLESVKFNPTLTRISGSAFYGCTALKSIELPVAINTIDSYAFQKCTSLNTVTINAMTPPAMTTSFEGVFPATAALRVPMAAREAYAQDPYWGGFKELLGAEVQNGLLYATLNGGNHEVQVLRLVDQTLEDVKVPEEMTSAYGGTFKVVSVGEQAFKDCQTMKTLSLPTTVHELGKEALMNTEGLVVILFTATPKAMGHTFEEVCGTSRPAISVPVGSGAAYQADAFWQGFEVREGWNRPVYTLNDGESYAKLSSATLEGVGIDYTRFYGHTKWQSLYIPFSMEYAEWSDQFEVARINNIHQNDYNEDGVYEETLLEILVMGEGSTLEPGVPYLIRAKQTGDLTLSLRDKNLMTPEEGRTLDCASLTTRYVFTGTYAPLTGETMSALQCYAMASGALKMAAGSEAALGAYRWYMTTENRDPEAAVQPKTILLRVIRDGEATGVERLDLSSDGLWPADVYDLQGRCVKVNAHDLSGLTRGIYVVNGKKVMKH